MRPLPTSSPEMSAHQADPELEAIRQRRMQELMAQHGGANQQNAGQQKAQEDAKQEAEEHRQMMLAQILSSEARERHIARRAGLVQAVESYRP
ncbi:uncharacterized protein C23C4.09c-like isoform X2 [Miscanthus floridulus]|uniref:uncharacterized protein C23C4.09c-like isoform X2 n=1 Tax=Miscanthus floridulus TaxID=154761 RepID=UPI0034597A2A